jgi:hypothetical protein
MCRRVLLARLDVLPGPAIPDHSLERRLEVPRDGWIRMLVDRHPSGRMRDVHHDRRPALAFNRSEYISSDVENMAAPLGADTDLAHESRLERAAGGGWCTGL